MIRKGCKNRTHQDREIEAIPPVVEVQQSQGEDLDCSFDSEDNEEHSARVVLCARECARVRAESGEGRRLRVSGAMRSV